MNKVVRAEALLSIDFAEGETLSVGCDNMGQPVETIVVRTGDGWTTERKRLSASSERPLPPDVIVEREL